MNKHLRWRAPQGSTSPVRSHPARGNYLFIYVLLGGGSTTGVHGNSGYLFTSSWALDLASARVDAESPEPVFALLLCLPPRKGPSSWFSMNTGFLRTTPMLWWFRVHDWPSLQGVKDFRGVPAQPSRPTV
jgi:hypothetical protein